MKNTKTFIFAACLVLGYSNFSVAMGKRPVKDPAPPNEPSPKPPAESREVTPLWESKHADGKRWTAHVDQKLDVLGKDILDVVPADYATFCPKYKTLTYDERKEFWAYLISAMVRFESNFDPDTKYTEDFSDSSGRKVVSRGLLQISIESGNSYGCDFKSTKDLHDPYQNLDCGLRILNRWLENDGRIAGKVSGGWKGGARYWSVLRSVNNPYASIVSWTKNISLCK